MIARRKPFRCTWERSSSALRRITRTPKDTSQSPVVAPVSLQGASSASARQEWAGAAVDPATALSATATPRSRVTSRRSISPALDHLGPRLHFVVLSRLPDHPSLRQFDPLSTAPIREGDRVGLGLSLVEPKRRITVSHQRGVGHDAKSPTVHPDHEIEDSARVPTGEEKGDHTEQNEQKDQPGAGAATPVAVRVAGVHSEPSAAGEDADDRVVRERQ